MTRWGCNTENIQILDECSKDDKARLSIDPDDDREDDKTRSANSGGMTRQEQMWRSDFGIEEDKKELMIEYG